MAEKEKQASKTLPKTGIPSVDSEAIMVQICLSRLASHSTVAKSKQSEQHGHQNFRKVSRIFVTPQGSTMNVSHRTQMGTDPLAVEVEDDTEFTSDRSDAVVAQSALMRLMQTAARALARAEFLSKHCVELTETKERNQQYIQELESKVHSLTAKLESLRDPATAFELYRDCWVEHHQDSQARLREAKSERKRAIELLIGKQKCLLAQRTDVSLKKRHFDRTDERLKEEFCNDDALFADVLQLFCPPSLRLVKPTAESTISTAQPSVEAADSTFSDGQLTPHEASPLAMPPAEGGVDQTDDKTAEEFVEKIHELSIDRVLDNVDQLLNDTSDENDEMKKQKEMETRKENLREELVITRRFDLPERTIRRQDSSATVVGVLMNVFLFSPVTYIVFRIEMHSIAGRGEQLDRQAKSLGIQHVWDEACLFSSPRVFVVECLPPTFDEVKKKRVLDRDLITMKVPKDPHAITFDALDEPEEFDPNKDVEVIAARRAHFERVMAFKRLAEGLQSSRNYMLMPEPAAKESFTLLQKPGIVSFIAHDFGESDKWGSPIFKGHIRCYSSSIAAACHVDALVQKYADLRTPYFCTEDGPGQTITISFHKMCIIPCAYSFASVHPVHGGLYPRSWRLEGSSDGVKWTVLRTHNEATLCRDTPCSFWELPSTNSKGMTHYFSQFRIVQTGLNAVGSHHLCASAFEVYGRVMFVLDDTIERSATLPPRTVRRRGFEPLQSLPIVATKGAKAKGKGKK